MMDDKTWYVIVFPRRRFYTR